MTAKDFMNDEAIRFAKLLSALNECTPETQTIVREMAKIISNPEATDDDRTHATDVILEALFPSLMQDFVEFDGECLRMSDKAQQAKSRLEKEEESFSDKLRTLMEKHDMSEKKLAELTGVGQPAISNMLNRRCRPQRRTIARFAEVFGVHPEDLWAIE